MVTSSFQIVLSQYLLWRVLGPSVLASLIFIVLLVPVQFYLSVITRRNQQAQMNHKDSRLRMMNEILNGIKVLKLYAWELAFEKKVLHIRDKELDVLKKTAIKNSVTTLIGLCTPIFLAVVTFAAFVLIDARNELTPELAFVSIS